MMQITNLTYLYTQTRLSTSIQQHLGFSCATLLYSVRYGAYAQQMIATSHASHLQGTPLPLKTRWVAAASFPGD